LLARALWRSAVRTGGAHLELEQHLDATYRWLCAAQDATPDGGVAGWFSLRSGWSTSYPETTGYIIPTFLALAEARSDPEARERALRMADWEADIQMQDGAVLSGVIGTPVGPAVFNTGQALFGWVSAFVVGEDERHAQAARAAGKWLVEHQDEDGAWRQSLSMLTSGSAPTYNNRCSWALAYAASVLGEDSFLEAARRNCEWTIAQQNELGWFAHTGFSDSEVPLLHTISYVIEGLLGVYAFSGESRYLDAARKAADAIVDAYRQRALAGRLDEQWRATVSWRCPTGEAQVAVVLHRLERLLPGNGYAREGRKLIEDVANMQTQLAHLGAGASDPIVGAVPGSFPIWGQYMRFCFPNWAAKFLLDALLLEVHGVEEKSFPETLAS
jgi:uncharacterized protein YyaL (SSP411 family)